MILKEDVSNPQCILPPAIGRSVFHSLSYNGPHASLSNAHTELRCPVGGLSTPTSPPPRHANSSPTSRSSTSNHVHFWDSTRKQVCEKGGAYADDFKIVREYFATKGRGASEKYFWKNSREIYRWIER